MVRHCEKYLKEIAAGRTEAVEHLYNVAGRAMYAVAVNILRDYQLAEDAIQESLINIMKKAADCRSFKAAYSWILTITRNCALDILRKRKHEVPSDEACFYETGTENISEVSLDVHNALGRINEESRNIVLFKAGLGLSHREIAGIMNISVDSCQKKYQRAIKQLKEYLS